jgi:hypothetical protein
MMLQLSLAIEAYPRAKRGALEIAVIRSHARKLFDAMSPLIQTSVKGDETLKQPGATFLFGGYSWRKKSFELWSISYSKGTKTFTADPAPTLCFDQRRQKLGTRFKPRSDQLALGKILFAGDQAAAARKLLFQRISGRVLASGQPPSRIDMEPFEVVRDMLRDPALRIPPYSDTIGGAPQVVRVFQYHRTAPFAVFWPDRAGRAHLHGRPCLSYEHIDKQVIDPDTLEEVYLHARDRSNGMELDDAPDLEE